MNRDLTTERPLASNLAVVGTQGPIMKNIRALLIDFGDTIAHVDRAQSARYATRLWQTLTENGYAGSLQQFEQSWYKILHETSRGTARSYSDLWNALLTELGMKRSTPLIEKLDATRRIYATDLFRLYEGVRRTLTELRRHYTLMLVSNCAYGMSETITQLGLGKYFARTILSYEVGDRKPDRRMYEKALEKSDLKPEECLFIADEISDLEGAREIGMKTLLVKQGKSTFCEAKDPGFQPDLQCEKISDVPQLLQIRATS